MDRNYDLLSLGEESVVYRKNDVVKKSYDPSHHPFFKDKHKKIFGKIADLSIARQHAFLEAKLLEALKDSGYVPIFRNFNPDKLEITMNYIPHPTVQEAKRDGIIHPSTGAEYLAKALVDFHNHTNSELNKLSDVGREAASATGGTNTLLKKRSSQEEKARWKNKVISTIYACSSDLSNYWKSNNLNPKNMSSEELRKQLYVFAMTQGVNIDATVDKIIDNDRKISGDEKTFVHGEFKDANVFYVENGKPVIFDLPRARKGSGSLFDPSSLLYTLDTTQFDAEIEKKSLDAAMTYYTLVEKNEDEFSSLKMRLLGKRVTNLVRALANYAKKNPYELHELAKRSKIGDQNPDEFLKQRLRMAEAHLEYYLRRDGKQDLQGSSNSEKDLAGVVTEQHELLFKMYKKLGVFPNF